MSYLVTNTYNVDTCLKYRNDGDTSFTLVGAVGEKVGGMEHAIRVKTKLFDILSSQSELDHPICEVSETIISVRCVTFFLEQQ